MKIQKEKTRRQLCFLHSSQRSCWLCACQTPWLIMIWISCNVISSFNWCWAIAADKTSRTIIGTICLQRNGRHRLLAALTARQWCCRCDWLSLCLLKVLLAIDAIRTIRDDGELLGGDGNTTVDAAEALLVHLFAHRNDWPFSHWFSANIADFCFVFLLLVVTIGAAGLVLHSKEWVVCQHAIAREAAEAIAVEVLADCFDDLVRDWFATCMASDRISIVLLVHLFLSACNTDNHISLWNELATLRKIQPTRLAAEAFRVVVPVQRLHYLCIRLEFLTADEAGSHFVY